jgi:hypothetical protein
MQWEAVTAIGTVFTGLVIFFTVLIGQRQIKVTVDQLRQLRRASQLDAANVIFAELASPTFIEARRFILNELPERLKDTRFRKELEIVGRADDSVHKELVILRTFERIALYVEQELLDPELIYYLASGRVIDTWEGLTEVVAIHRKSLNPSVWEHYEKLYNDVLAFRKFKFDKRHSDKVISELRAAPEHRTSEP